MDRIIRYDHSVVLACDVRSMKEFEHLIEKTCDVRGIGAYKIGSILTIRYGLPLLVQTARKFTDIPIIYDHQKAMTDIGDLGKEFMNVVKESGADAVIGFPQSGPFTEESWITASRNIGLKVIVGGEMTHPKYKRSEGGYIADESLDDIYLLGARLGVNNFVVPGNKSERVSHYKYLLKSVDSLTFFAPGFVTQGGTITDVAMAAKDIFWHAIVGRAIYEAKDVRKAAEEMVSQLPL